MNFISKFIFFITLITMLASCGADKLKSTKTTDQLGLSAPLTCSCNSSYSPVCSKGNDFENTCLAQCHGAVDITAGHCDCSQNAINVCGNDGLDHTECYAREHNIEIIKYIPCAASGI